MAGEASTNATPALGGGLRLVMLGAPGSGKGTQAEALAERLGIPTVSTGEMLRGAVAAATLLGQRVELIMAQGALVDDGTMAEVVRERLAESDARGGFILDGFPRTLPQAAALEAILDDSGAELDAVLQVDVPAPELVRRALGRRRADDREEVIRTRLEVYREQTEPLIGYYQERGLLRLVDGYQSVEAVTAAILSQLAVEA